MDSLSKTLKETFGFNAFRPLQREIIESSMSGRDVFVLLPTGGGKSLCYQLPALLRPGLTVVVSPLIALMKDQVDQLQAAGVPATFMNSTLGAPTTYGLRRTASGRSASNRGLASSADAASQCARSATMSTRCCAAKTRSCT